MTYKSRRSVLASGNDRVLLNAFLLLVCASLSALGVGVLGIVLFVPLALLADRVLVQFRQRRHSIDHRPTAGAREAALGSHCL